MSKHEEEAVILDWFNSFAELDFHRFAGPFPQN